MQILSIYSFNLFLPFSSDRVFCIHEALGEWINLAIVCGSQSYSLWMNRSEVTPLWKAANKILSSISSTNRDSLLKRLIKDCKLLFSPCSMFSKLDKECLCLWPLTKLLTNSLLNSWKEVMVFGGILPNHAWVGPLSRVRKALHIISSRTLQCDHMNFTFLHTSLG